MIRHAAAVAVVVCLNPAWLFAQATGQSAAQTQAQGAELRVSAASVNVHRSPSTGSPVIGTARRGAVLPVARELGSWVKVSWPDGEDGAGYVHVSAGSVSHGAIPARNVGAAYATTQLAAQPAQPTTTRAEQTIAPEASGSMRTTYVSPPTHIVGLGARMSGSILGFGVTGRVWSHDQFGIQLDLSRSAITSTAAPGRVTSMQFAPSLIYSLADRVSDYVWVRPYVGGGANLNRQTWSSGTPDAVDAVSDSTFGFRAFGGGEFTFASVPRFAVSADVGYDWSKSSFTGFDFGGLGFSVSGHWYVR
jgi:opacity protein-like surface antigen